MIRKLLVGLGAVGLLAGIAPSPAQAAQAGVVVFTGQADVGSTAWTGTSPTAVGEGLCFPGKTNTAGCPTAADPIAALSQPDQSWSFTVPGNAAPLPSVCLASGVFGGSTAQGTSCTIDANGYVGANAAGVGPSCGMSEGTSAGGPTGHTDQFDPDGAGPLPAQNITVTWVTSAGGTLPIMGDFGGSPFAGVVQARPLADGACNSNPAAVFTVAGVAATAGA